MQVIIAKNAGFCFGVKRAVDIVEKALEQGETVYCLGSLIHNHQVIERLEKKGLVTVEKIEDIPAGSKFIVRSHGIAPEIVEKIKTNGGEILDATCPFVRRAQLVAKKFHEDGFDVVLCGDPHHAEVLGINAWAGNSAMMIHDASEAKGLKFKKTVGILSQTTQKIDLLKNTVANLLENNKKLIIENTICLDSSTKQAEVSALAKEVDVMIVIGGRDSSNTGKLVQLSEAQKIPTYHIETASELHCDWFLNAEKIGIAAGASTAKFLIDDVVDKINNLC